MFLLSVFVGCIKGFRDINSGKIYTSDATHFIVPDMNFSCNGIIAEITFSASYQGGQSGAIQFEVWRPQETSDSLVITYSRADETYSTQFLESHAMQTLVIVRPSMTVSSKDILGISIGNLSIFSQPFDSFTVYQLKSDATFSTQANIPSSYTSTFFSPLVSVSFGEFVCWLSESMRPIVDFQIVSKCIITHQSPWYYSCAQNLYVLRKVTEILSISFSTIGGFCSSHPSNNQ